MADTLERAVEASEIVDALKSFGVTQVDVAAVAPRGVGQWLHAKNRLLDGERPVDLLAEDHYEEVRSAAEAFVGGSYV